MLSATKRVLNYYTFPGFVVHCTRAEHSKTNTFVFLNLQRSAQYRWTVFGHCTVQSLAELE